VLQVKGWIVARQFATRQKGPPGSKRAAQVIETTTRYLELNPE